jgi:hypothetical protein
MNFGKAEQVVLANVGGAIPNEDMHDGDVAPDDLPF